MELKTRILIASLILNGFWVAKELGERVFIILYLIIIHKLSNMILSENPNDVLLRTYVLKSRLVKNVGIEIFFSICQ